MLDSPSSRTVVGGAGHERIAAGDREYCDAGRSPSGSRREKARVPTSTYAVDVEVALAAVAAAAPDGAASGGYT